MDELWDKTVKQLEQTLGEQALETWIKPIRIHYESSNKVDLQVPSKFFRDWLSDHFLAAIEGTLSSLSHEHMTVTVSINPQLQKRGIVTKVVDLPRQKGSATLSLIPKYTFENFVIGASNQFAHAASLAVANQPGQHYNPLFIYGGVGLGKTHLVNAIGHRVGGGQRGMKVVYLPSESFMNELIGSLRRDKMDEFKKRFRNVDVLILDDVQFLAGKERTQEEFFHTFNSLYESHKQIIITSDKFPKDIPELENRLRNRFEWGLIADIQPPDMETRVAILEKKAEMEAVKLPHEVALFLASHIDSNVRELEGSLTRLGAFASLTQAEISIDLAQVVLQNTLRGMHREVTVENIQKTICDHFNIRMADLKSKRRTQNITLPRHVAMYLCRKYTSISFPAIGEKFGGRDHSTVIHASRSIEKKIKNDLSMRFTVERLEKTIKV